tara:strand:- start:124 stop:411 length:288 start_codon:yes stop_codon:yes gene_type:complete
MNVVNIGEKKDSTELYRAVIRTSSKGELVTYFTGYLFDKEEGLPDTVFFLYNEKISETPHLMINMANIEFIEMELIKDDDEEDDNYTTEQERNDD